MVAEASGDERLTRWVRFALLLGMASSFALLLLGFILLSLKEGQVTDAAIPLNQVFALALRRDPLAVISLGLLLLLSTPILYVLLALASFLWERDRGFVAISLIVLSIIAVSILLAPQ